MSKIRDSVSEFQIKLVTLCSEKNNTVVEMTLPDKNNQLFASKYSLFLPTKKELIAQVRNVD